MARTDDDSWDLATGVGATATLVAAGRARAARAAQPLIDDPFAEPLVRAVGVEFLTRWATGELDAADVDDPDAAWGLQRMTTELVVRTRYFDQFFLDAAAAGVRQAVILASGLDARGYRLPWPADTTVFEVDQPRVLEFKAQTLAGLGAQPTADLRMVPADLRHDWPDALRRGGFDAAEPAASRLALEAFLGSADRDSARVEEMIRTATRGWREHGFHLDIWALNYAGPRHEVSGYLDNHGWRSVGTTTAQLLAAHDLPAAPALPAGLADRPNYWTCVLG